MRRLPHDRSRWRDRTHGFSDSQLAYHTSPFDVCYKTRRSVIQDREGGSCRSPTLSYFSGRSRAFMEHLLHAQYLASCCKDTRRRGAWVLGAPSLVMGAATNGFSGQLPPTATSFRSVL